MRGKSMKAILQYLRDTYRPTTLIVYGSYVDGTYDDNSDYDALLVVEKKSVSRDNALIDGVHLDAWIYTRAEMEEMDPSGYLQILDGNIMIDRDGFGQGLKDKLRDYMKNHTCLSAEEKRLLIFWCRKMLERAGRGDDEGLYRACWLLTESLEIYCNLRDQIYLGAKKSIQWIRETDPQGSALLSGALSSHSMEALTAWITYLSLYERKIHSTVEESGI